MTSLELAKLYSFDALDFEYKQRPFGFFEANFKYAVLRFIYHYNNFQKEYSVIHEYCEKNFNKPDNGDWVAFNWNNNLMFEFDAVYYSAQAIINRNLLNDAAKELSPKEFKLYESFCKKVLENHKKLHKRIRDDVVHLNKTNHNSTTYGTSSRISTNSTHMIIYYYFSTDSIKIITSRDSNNSMINFFESVDELQIIITNLINVTYHHLILSYFDIDHIQSSKTIIDSGFGTIRLKDYLYDITNNL